MNGLRCFFILVFVFSVAQWDLQGQVMDTSYQWSRLANIENYARNHGIRTNFYGEIFTYDWYSDSIFIEDTSFIHTGGSPISSDFNVAIIKRDSEGRFIKAGDFYTKRNSHIWTVDVQIDKESNILVYGSFTDTLYYNNEKIFVPDVNMPNLFLVKLDRDLNFIWGKTISCIYQDESGNLAISEDNHYYLTANHMHPGSDTVSRVAYYLGQDSAYVDSGLNSLIKIDSDGTILWIREVRDPYSGQADVGNTVYGQDGNIYMVGDATTYIFIEGDTIEHPTFPEWGSCPFIVKFDQQGNYRDAFFHNFGMGVPFDLLEVDHNSNYYLPGMLYQTMVFGNDTITISGDTMGYTFLKLDSIAQVVWHESFKINYSTQIFPHIRIDLHGDSLAFALYANKSFTLAGINFDFGYREKILTGLFSPEGELVFYHTPGTTVNGDRGSRVFWMSLDNCGNHIFNGNFKGALIFENDTLISDGHFSRYLAKNARNKPPPLKMPSDTSGCGMLTLTAPEGYLYYAWNGELSNQNWYTVNSSDLVYVKAANEDGCWAEGETLVQIYPPIELSLGNDTSILLTDTLQLDVSGEYESYAWSTGDTTNSLAIPASELEIGNNLIWLDVTKGPCSASDTLLVEVIDDFSVSENSHEDISIYPNPTSTKFKIISNSHRIPYTIKIYDCVGNLTGNYRLSNGEVDVSNLKAGIYIVNITFENAIIQRKLIVF